MKTVEEMTLEELRVAYVDLAEQHKATTNELESAKATISAKEEEAKDLRKYNNELFQRVPVISPKAQEEDEAPQVSLEEMALQFGKGE